MSRKYDKSTWVSYSCLECDKVFFDYIARKRKYCSASCRSKYVMRRDGAWHKGIKTGLVPRSAFKKGSGGENHWNWKGGRGTIRHRLMQQSDYRDWRKAVFERDNYTCQHCGITGVYVQADHIKPWAKYPKLRYRIDNGRTLCVDCHEKTETFPASLRRRVVA